MNLVAEDIALIKNQNQVDNINYNDELYSEGADICHRLLKPELIVENNGV